MAMLSSSSAKTDLGLADLSISWDRKRSKDIHVDDRRGGSGVSIRGLFHRIDRLPV
jgi:hypothetical protein